MQSLEKIVDCEICGFSEDGQRVFVHVSLLSGDIFVVTVDADDLLMRCAQLERVWPQSKLH